MRALNCFLLSLLLFTTAHESAADEKPREAGEGTGNVVLIELFTSQGCSSCPSADQLLAKLGQDPTLRGKIIPLAFHVDYWNYLGWSDPFSSSAWSDRQRRYSQRFALGQVYTPQAVVNGSAQLVGSNERAIRTEITRASRMSSASRLSLMKVAANAGAVELSYRVDLKPGASSKGLELFLAVYENDISTPVKRGENAGRKLANSYVVRRLDRVTVLKAGSTSAMEGRLRIPLDPKWNRGKMGAALFLQEAQSGRVHGAVTSAI